MFQNGDLTQLQERKHLLVLQSELNRRQLAEDWRTLRSPEHWLGEANRAMRRHPVGTATLAAAVGVLAMKTLRRPGAVLSGIGRVGKAASMAFTALKLFRRKK